MTTIGWIVSILLGCSITAVLSYWFGYRCGQQDYKDGWGNAHPPAFSHRETGGMISRAHRRIPCR
jgi:hypothetical protein